MGWGVRSHIPKNVGMTIGGGGVAGERRGAVAAPRFGSELGDMPLS
jgi:hypothetical protein